MKKHSALLIFPRQYQMGYMKLKRDYTARRYPPLGLLYISSALKSIGYDVDFLDETVKPVSTNVFKNNNYSFMGFYADATTKESIATFIAKIRQVSDAPIIVGGPATFLPEIFIQNKNVIVCHGEGEETVKELASVLENNGALSGIKGISFKEGSEVINTGARELIQDLDAIPFPDRSVINIEDYHDHYNLNSKGIFSTLVTSRGCPMGCAYCSSSNFWGRKVRFRSVDNVMEEIIHIKQEYSVRYMDFVDDMINLNEAWLNELCDRMIKEKLNMNWSCNMFPTSMSVELLKKMRRSGANTIKLGVQSASPEILARIHRGANSVENARKLIHNARRVGFIVFLDFIFGLPGENEETIEKSVNFALSTNPHIAKFYKLDLLEGSELYNRTNSGFTSLTQEKLEESCKSAWKRFYLRPRKVLDFAWMYIFNPSKIVRIFRYVNVFKSVMK